MFNQVLAWHNDNRSEFAGAAAAEIVSQLVFFNRRGREIVSRLAWCSSTAGDAFRIAGAVEVSRGACCTTA